MRVHPYWSIHSPIIATLFTLIFIYSSDCAFGQGDGQAAKPKKLDPDSVEAKLLKKKELDRYKAFAASTKMVLIPGGTFKGKTIQPFYMDVDLVNVGQYKAAVRMGVCPQPPKTDDVSDSWKLGNNLRAQNNVNWYAANSFLSWVGKRLPTEHEWEWVARGRDEGRIYPWGNRSHKKKTPAG